MPWEQNKPDSGLNTPAEPPAYPAPVQTATVQKSGGFPAIIFIIAVILILVAIGIFLFTQKALPFQG